MLLPFYSGSPQLRFKNALLLIVSFLLISSHAYSQNQNKPPDRMKMLTAFNGEWKGEMVTMVEKKKIKYKLSHTSEKIAGGWGIQLTEVAMIPEKGKYQAARIFSYSSTSDTTYMYTVDNFGETWFFTGIWETNKKLILKSTMESKGKKIEKAISYLFLNPKEYEYKSISRTEGSPDEIVEMKMMRQ
ncbi:MAG TPA: DUF1579 family protein [Bacteroidia bacterium]|nr:DUF1579 family protein [Bacteroidia bacterium]